MKKTLLVVFFCALTLFAFTSCGKNDESENNSNNPFKKNHTVTLVVENLSNEAVTVDDGEVLNINFTPRKDDCIFMGWYTDSACMIPYDFSRPVTTSFKLYAGFSLKIKTFNCSDIKIKALSSTYNGSTTFALSLDGFDYSYLEKKGMGLQFKVMYSVKYKKDYDVPYDIGYAGSPKYELSLNNGESGYQEENLSTTKSAVEKCYTYNTPLNFSKDGLIYLAFSTDNVQNIISFSNIVITVEALKVR